MRRSFVGLLRRYGARLDLLIMLLVFLISPRSQPVAQCQDPPAVASNVMTIDDLFAEVGRRVPAFGGMFVDEAKDTLYVYMVPGEAGDVASLREALIDLLGDGLPPEHRLEVLSGQYTFRELKAWKVLINQSVPAIPGVDFTTINENKNRLEVGIENSTVAPTLEAFLMAVGIPHEAVNIEEAQPVRSSEFTPADGGPLTDIDDIGMDKVLKDNKFRPLVGGLQIQIFVKGLAKGSNCTLGFLATRKGVPGLVTNDHCVVEHQQRALNLNMVYQPTEDPKYQVGTVSVDPEFLKPGSDDKCLAKYDFCRFSDSAFAELTDKAADPVGFIAKPNGTDWDGEAKFRIVGLAEPMEDMSVTRVSSQTGIDTGQISNTCKDFEVQDETTRKKRGTGTWFLCQVQVKWKGTVVKGDSGSPVFITNKDNDDVMLLGILWGDTAVSPIRQVKITGSELGPELLVCAKEDGKQKC